MALSIPDVFFLYIVIAHQVAVITKLWFTQEAQDQGREGFVCLGALCINRHVFRLMCACLRNEVPFHLYQSHSLRTCLKRCFLFSVSACSLPEVPFHLYQSDSLRICVKRCLLFSACESLQESDVLLHLFHSQFHSLRIRVRCRTLLHICVLWVPEVKSSSLPMSCFEILCQKLCIQCLRATGLRTLLLFWSDFFSTRLC